MRRLLLFLIIILSVSALSAAWQFGVDLRCIDSIFLDAVRVDAEAGYRWGSIRVSVPVRYSASLSYELSFLEASLFVSAYPFDELGLFVGASMVRAGLFWGLESPEERFILFSEIAAGWTFSFPWFFVEPRISILDAFSSEAGRLGELGKAVPQYSKIRISLIAGIEIP